MNHAPFIFAAYAFTGLGMVWLCVASFVSMRRSEALARDVSERG